MAVNATTRRKCVSNVTMNTTIETVIQTLLEPKDIKE